jgi:hypothetical protein
MVYKKRVDKYVHMQLQNLNLFTKETNFQLHRVFLLHAGKSSSTWYTANIKLPDEP